MLSGSKQMLLTLALGYVAWLTLGSIGWSWAGDESLSIDAGVVSGTPDTSNVDGTPSVVGEKHDREPLVIVADAILKTIEATDLAAESSGVIERLDVSEGAVVEQGQLLGWLRRDAADLKVKESQIAWEIAKKKAASDIDTRLAAKVQAVAANEYQRAVDANRRVAGVYPVNEIDRLRLVYDKTTLEGERAAFQRQMDAFEVQTAEVQYHQAVESLKRHEIVAPVGGVVVAVDQRPGEWVEPGTSILEIVAIDRLRIEGFVDAEDASLADVGRSASVSVRLGDRVVDLEATIVFVSPEINPINGQARIFLELDNTEHQLRPGLRPEVSFARL